MTWNSTKWLTWFSEPRCTAIRSIATKKELEAVARQLHALTLTTIGTSPVLCGVKSIEAVGVAENGRTYNLRAEMKLRIRDYSGRVKYGSDIVTLNCENTESLTAKYVVLLGEIREHELAEHIQPELKFYLPVKRCMDFSSIRFAITLFNGEVLSFQHKLPSKSVLQELPNKSVLETTNNTALKGKLPILPHCGLCMRSMMKWNGKRAIAQTF